MKSWNFGTLLQMYPRSHSFVKSTSTRCVFGGENHFSGTVFLSVYGTVRGDALVSEFFPFACRTSYELPLFEFQLFVPSRLEQSSQRNASGEQNLFSRLFLEGN